MYNIVDHRTIDELVNRTERRNLIDQFKKKITHVSGPISELDDTTHYANVAIVFLHFYEVNSK